jgi:SAM-dependent methyltransferase
MSYAERLAKNNQYYDRFAQKVSARSEKREFSRAFTSFTRYVDKSGVILDIGCGTGNHLKQFQAKGFLVFGVEPSAGMRKIAYDAGLPVIDGTFETLEKLALPKVSGVWCVASLLHVALADLPAVLRKIAALLSTDAPLFLTVRLGEGEEWDKLDDDSVDVERHIQLFTEPYLTDQLGRAGFTIAERWIEDSTWGRPAKWISILARKG